jgi:hypothetical protein
MVSSQTPQKRTFASRVRWVNRLNKNSAGPHGEIRRASCLWITWKALNPDPERRPMQPIEPLSPAACDYLTSFGAVAITVDRYGRVRITRDPHNVSLCWWCREADARKIVEVAQRDGDVVGAAARLSIKLTAHETAAAKAREKVAQLEAALQAAQQDGLLKFFNSQYREFRLRAKAQGKPFMSYQQASRRLRAAVASIIAKGGVIERSLFTDVFK